MSWTDKVKNYVKLEEGTTTLDIIDEPTVKISEKYNNERLMLRTHMGIWASGINGPVARELKKYALEHNNGKLKGTTIVVSRTGSGSDTRYKLLKIEPTQKQTPLTTNQVTMEQFEQKTKNWPETDKQAYLEYLKQTGRLVEL